MECLMQEKLIIMDRNSLYIITGGPGAGKTTLIRALEQRGFKVIPEDARRIIKEQAAINGDGLPWKNKALYAQLMLEAAVSAHQHIARHNSSKPVFFDRGLPDTICYMKMEALPIPEQLAALVSAYPYARKVFILPPWKEIYTTDTERKQSWDEAAYTFEQMKATYTQYGYEVIEVPKGSMEARGTFIITHTTGLNGD